MSSPFHCRGKSLPPHVPAPEAPLGFREQEAGGRPQPAPTSVGAKIQDRTRQNPLRARTHAAHQGRAGVRNGPLPPRPPSR